MTQDEIIRMAREAGFPFNKYELLQGDDNGEIDAHEMLERFAALVAAHEREKEMKAAEKAIYVAIGLEREACAKVCDEQFKKYGCVADKCAAAIRAR